MITILLTKMSETLVTLIQGYEYNFLSFSNDMNYKFGFLIKISSPYLSFALVSDEV